MATLIQNSLEVQRLERDREGVEIVVALVFVRLHYSGVGVCSGGVHEDSGDSHTAHVRVGGSVSKGGRPCN